MKKTFQFIKKTYEQWMSNSPFEQSAVIAYYTLFSLPSLLIIIITIAGYFFETSDVQGKIISEVASFTGEETALTIETMITNARIKGENFLNITVSVLMLIFGATGAFFQLKKAMNRIWSVRAKKDNLMRMILDRAISFGMIIVIGFMLLISLVISTVVSALSEYISNYAPEITSYSLEVFNFLLSYIFIGTLFAGIFKLLPDIKIRWKITFVGASLTTVLFLLGKYLLGFYFSESDPASVYGGASSVILILLWVFYSCLIMFFGAEFTVQYALYRNETITPNSVAEPAYYQEMEELEEEKNRIKKKKKQIDKLSS